MRATPRPGSPGSGACSSVGWQKTLPGRGPGWDPYPVSRRIVNWVKWALLGQELPPECRTSLAVQARWLGGRLEYHLLGNHLLANAAALVHAGLYFDRSGGGGLVPAGMRHPGAPAARAGAGRRWPLRAQPDVPRARARVAARPRQSAADLRPADPASSGRSSRRTCARWLARDDAPGRRASPSSTTPPSGIAPTPRSSRRMPRVSGSGAVAVPPQALVVLRRVATCVGGRRRQPACATVRRSGRTTSPAHAHADTLSFELSLLRPAAAGELGHVAVRRRP